MTKFAKLLSLILVFCFMLSLFSCAEAASGGGGGYYGGYYGDTGAVLPEEGGEDDNTIKEDKEEITLPSGMITAGAHNDNDNYQLWLSLFAAAEGESDTDGKFYSYISSQRSWGFDSLNRVKVSVLSGGLPVAGAEVIAFDNDGNKLFTAISDAQGYAYLFPEIDDGFVLVMSGVASESAEFSADEREITVELETHAEKMNVIELMFVVDVTGSMGDELRFLQTELDDVIKKIASNDSETVIRLSLLFYRDHTDKQVFEFCNFVDITDEGGLKSTLDKLATQKARGGGDYEEAVDEALEMAVNAQWSDGATTKLIFHVLDAPAHDKDEYQARFNNAVIAAAEKGIRISPIICSGAAETTEYTMRQAAIYTGGTFIFVTDDSGIGGEHHDPEIPNVTVELLNTMLVRLINGYHTGEFEDPIFWKDDPALGNK